MKRICTQICPVIDFFNELENMEKRIESLPVENSFTAPTQVV